MDSPIVSLLVLRTSKMEAALSSYRALGLDFVEEKHGAGPTHYSTQLGPTVVEIYPGDPAQALDRKASGATMLGLVVESVDAVVAAVEQLGSQVASAPRDSNWGRRAVVLDPDGRAVELSEPTEA